MPSDDSGHYGDGADDGLIIQRPPQANYDEDGEAQNQDNFNRN